MLPRQLPMHTLTSQQETSQNLALLKNAAPTRSSPPTPAGSSGASDGTWKQLKSWGTRSEVASAHSAGHVGPAKKTLENQESRAEWIWSFGTALSLHLRHWNFCSVIQWALVAPLQLALSFRTAYSLTPTPFSLQESSGHSAPPHTSGITCFFPPPCLLPQCPPLSLLRGNQSYPSSPGHTPSPS